jgi:hypothetical protein
VKAAGIVLDADLLAAIDAAVGDVVTRDPALTAKLAPKARPS